jgi:hypothetical protein
LFVLLAGLFLVGWVVDSGNLPGVSLAALGVWGVLVSDLAARDAQSGCDALSAAVPGGAIARYVRQLGVTLSIGVIAVAPALVRWAGSQPVAALTMLIGLLLITAIATLLARLTRGGRTFFGMFLLFLYLSTQLKMVRWFDAFGLFAAADGTTRLTYLLVAVVMITSGWLVTQRTLK